MNAEEVILFYVRTLVNESICYIYNISKETKPMRFETKSQAKINTGVHPEKSGVEAYNDKVLNLLCIKFKGSVLGKWEEGEGG